MNDLISRQAAIEALEARIDEVEPPKYGNTRDYDIGRQDGLDNAVNIIEALPPAEQRAGRWIPVSVRLPETKRDGEIEIMGERQQEMVDSTFELSEPVMVTRNGNVEIGQWEIDDPQRKYWVDTSGIILDGVTAWMPLPAPYKEVTDYAD